MLTALLPVMRRCHYRVWQCNALGLPCSCPPSSLSQSRRTVYTRFPGPLKEKLNSAENPTPGRAHPAPQLQRQARPQRSAHQILLDTHDRETVEGPGKMDPPPLKAHSHDRPTGGVRNKKSGGTSREEANTARSRVFSPSSSSHIRSIQEQVPVKDTALSSSTRLHLLNEEKNASYDSTIRKRVVPRHTGTHGKVKDLTSAYQSADQRRDAADLRSEETRSIKRDGYDPALVVHVDSSRRQVRLNDVQRELIWTARQKQYHDLLQRIVACLQSHRSPIEKCHTLYSLHDEAIKKHLRLRSDTYEDIFHTVYSVGVRSGGGAGQPGKASLSSNAEMLSGIPGCGKDFLPQDNASVSTGGAVPVELLEPSAAASTVLSPRGIENLWEMYRYLVDSGTDPTPRILQYVMGLLEHASVSLAMGRSHRTHRARSSDLLLVEAKAHSLMMDADRFHLAPSEYTINSYIAICEACDVMHLAMARVTDYQTRQERQASPGMYARLLTGLVRCGHYTDAMAAVTTMQSVALSTHLVNAVLQAARHSRDPASVFTFYRSVFFTANPLRMGDDGHTKRGDETEKSTSLRRIHRTSRPATGLVPSLATFSIMVEVMLQTRDYTELAFVIAEMQHHGVKGNGRLLNKLLKMMHTAGRPQSELRTLRRAMEAKQVCVFDENKTLGEVSSLEWGETEQGHLHRFLEGFTSPDPVVQASNLEKLQALSQYPSALVSTLAIVCDAAIPVTVRLSATTVARQLLHGTDRLLLYLSAAGNDPTTAAQSIMEALLHTALSGSPSPSSATTTTPLHRATGNLIACLLSALAHTGLATTATAVWSSILSFLLLHTDPAIPMMHDVDEAGREHTVQCWARCAALLREICDDPLANSKVLRAWVGGLASESLPLCTLFAQVLQLLDEQMGAEMAARGAAARWNALWLEDTLTSLQTCVQCGVLPCDDSYLSSAPTRDYLANSPAADSSSANVEEGPAAQALRAVCAAVHRIRCSAQDLILRRVLGHLNCSTEGGTEGRLLHAELAHAAPFVAVGMRYMADAVALEAIDPPHDFFHNAATPLLARFCRAVCLAQLQYDGSGDSDSVHAAVLACINYITERVNAEGVRSSTFSSIPAACSAHPSTARVPTVGCASCLYTILVDAATLPTSVADALEKHTTHQLDSASDFLARSAAGRRRGPPTSDDEKSHEGWASISAKPAEEKRNASAALTPAKCEKQDDMIRVDMLEAALPDHGTLRQAVAWCVGALSCDEQWMMAVAPLVVRFTATPRDGHLDGACTVESTLFVINELLDVALAEDGVSSSAVASTPQLPVKDLAEQVRGVLSLLSPPTQAGWGTQPPFFVRIQAVRYVGRLWTGFLEAWPNTFSARHADAFIYHLVERTRTVMLATGGLEILLRLVLRRLTTETSKAVQVECVNTLKTVITSCLKVMEQLMRSSMDGKDASDLEEESLDSTSLCSSHRSAGDGEEDGAAPPPHGEPYERMRIFSQSFGTTPDLRTILEALHAVSAHLPSFQWSVREAVYHLFSQALPLLWRIAPVMDSHSPNASDHTEATASSSAQMVTAQALEALARQYETLLSSPSVSDSTSSMLEMTTVLTSMADVTSAMDGRALEVVVPWILQVAHHMLSLYAHFLDCRAHPNHSPMANRTGGMVDMTDMCMVSLDLVSCVCDSVIDRDALLEHQLRPDETGHVLRAIDARLMALTESLLRPIATKGIERNSTLGSDTVCEALPNRCISLLGACQSLPDHPTNIPTHPISVFSDGGGEDEALGPLDEFGEVRRACFAIVYDCIFLCAYPSSLFRPPHTAVEPGMGSVSGLVCLSDSLGRDLVALCMREVLPPTNPSPPSPSTEYTEHLRYVSAHNVAASDAWLCLGSLLSLWDQQHWSSRLTAPSGGQHPCEGEGGPSSLFYTSGHEPTTQLHSHHLHTLNGLLSLLQDKSATITSNARLNMTSAVCGLALLLSLPDHPKSHPGAFAPVCPLPYTIISAVFSVASSSRIESYAADAASGDLCGINEAAHVLWCLGRLWQNTVQSLPYDTLCLFMRSHGRETAKTIVWWTRCVFPGKRQLTPAVSPALVSATFWGSLLELWRPVAHTLVQATQEGVLSLTKAQLSALGQLVRL